MKWGVNEKNFTTLPLHKPDMMVLEYLLENCDRTVPYNEVFEVVWGVGAMHNLRVSISRLRAYFGDYGLIETTSKLGYRITLWDGTKKADLG